MIFWRLVIDIIYIHVPCPETNKIADGMQPWFLRASIMSIRGARSSRHRPANAVLLEPVEVQVAEGHI